MKNIDRQTHVLDATDKVLGRFASEIAMILRGKHKPSFTPHIDGGDTVVVKNAALLVVSGKNKKDQKKYYRHSGHAGALKTETLGEVWERRGPEEVLRRAVSKMLPKNKLRAKMIKRLTIYR